MTIRVEKSSRPKPHRNRLLFRPQPGRSPKATEAGRSLSAATTAQLTTLVRMAHSNKLSRDTPRRRAALAELRNAAVRDTELKVLLGYLLVSGVLGRKQKSRAARLFSEAASLGDATGMVNYGVALVWGEGVSKNVHAGLRLIRRAVHSGQPDARMVLRVAKRFINDKK